MLQLAREGKKWGVKGGVERVKWEVGACGDDAETHRQRCCMRGGGCGCTANNTWMNATV